MVDFLAFVEKNEKFEQRKKRLQKEKLNFSSRRVKAENKAKILLGAYFYSDDKRLSSLMEEKDFIAYMSNKDFEFLRGMAYVAFPDKFNKPEELDHTKQSKQKSKKKIQSRKSETTKNDTPGKLNEVSESAAQESPASIQISSLSPELPWEEVDGQLRLYLNSKYEERDAIINTANSIFGEKSRAKFYDFDKVRGQWFIVKIDSASAVDFSPLRKWILA